VLESLGRVRDGFDEVVRAAQPDVPFLVKASTGMGATWANVPWVAALDPAETSSAQHGRYVTLMIAADGSRLVLAVVWGTQQVRRELGAAATGYLQRRRARGSELLAEHLEAGHRFTLNEPAPLAAGTALARDYERSCLAFCAFESVPAAAVLTECIAQLARANTAFIRTHAAVCL
jgi:hypothetical protein